MAIPDTEVERQIQQMIQFIDHEADEKEVEILAKVCSLCTYVYTY